MPAKFQTEVQEFIYEKLSLSDAWDECIYCLSPETAYLAGMLLERYPTWRSRWRHENGDPLTDLEWDIAEQIVSRAVGELMACNDIATALQNGLSAIADAMQRTGGGGTVNCYPGQLADCLVGVPNEDWTNPDGSTEEDPLTEPPPEGFDTWEEYYTWKCQAANYIWQWLLNLCYALGGVSGLQLTSAIVVPIVAGLAGLLPAAFTPVGFVAFVGAIVAIGAISLIGLSAAVHMGNYLNDHKDEIVCALYHSGSSADALTALAGYIEDGIEAGVLAAGLGEVAGPLVATLLGEAFGLVQNTGLVEPLFKIVADVSYPGATCDCGDVGDLLVTQPFPSFLTILIGGPERLDGAAQSPDYGWRIVYGSSDANRAALGFTTDGAVTELRLRFRVRKISGDGVATFQTRTYGGGGEITNFDLGNITPSANTWYDVDVTRSISLSAATQYELFMACEFDVTLEVNSIHLQATV